MNSRLRSAIQAARTANMPKENIERAINKSQLKNESNFESIRYEGFGPEKIAIVVETLTDNKNRTASNVRTIFQKNGGSLGTQGVASHNFNHLGVIRVKKDEISENELFDISVEAGAIEYFTKEDIYEIHTDKNLSLIHI